MIWKRSKFKQKEHNSSAIQDNRNYRQSLRTEDNKQQKKDSLNLVKIQMQSRREELQRLARLLAKIGDSMVEKHAIVAGKIKATKPKKRGSRKSIADELKELSRKLTRIGDGLHERDDTKAKGVKALLQPAKQLVRNILVRVVRKL